MATTKKTTKAAAEKAETKATEAKATKTATKATKTTTKAAKAETAAVAEAKTEKKAPAKKAAPKKTAPKKPAAVKKATSKEAQVNFVVEVAGKQISTEKVVEDIKAVIGKDVKDLTVYFKPEENTAYFVADGESGKMEFGYFD